MGRICPLFSPVQSIQYRLLSLCAAHIVCDCPYLEPLRLLLTRLWSCLYPDVQTPPLLSLSLTYGHVGSDHDHAAAMAIRGAFLTATRWARISFTSEAGAVNPAALVSVYGRVGSE